MVNNNAFIYKEFKKIASNDWTLKTLFIKRVFMKVGISISVDLRKKAEKNSLQMKMKKERSRPDNHTFCYGYFNNTVRKRSY